MRSLPTPLLRSGDPFHELTLTVPGGKTVTVPTMFVGQFGVVLFYSVLAGLSAGVAGLYPQVA